MKVKITRPQGPKLSNVFRIVDTNMLGVMIDMNESQTCLAMFGTQLGPKMQWYASDKLERLVEGTTLEVVL